MDVDVKMTNGDVIKDAASDPDVVMVGTSTNEDGDQEEAPRKALHRKICHSCYFQRCQEQDKPIVVDLSTPIVVV